VNFSGKVFPEMFVLKDWNFSIIYSSFKNLKIISLKTLGLSLDK
jgi:hypothetical protein